MRVKKESTPTPEVIEQLIEGLADEDGAAREKARQSFMSLREKAVPFLVKALADRRQQVRWEAAKALGQINSPIAAPALVKALGDRDFDVRWLAAEALIALGPGGVAPLLEALIKHAKSRVFRENAHHILNHIAGLDTGIEHHIAGHPKGMPQMKELLAPVVSALDGITPLVEVPLAARKALDALAETKPG